MDILSLAVLFWILNKTSGYSKESVKITLCLAATIFSLLFLKEKISGNASSAKDAAEFFLNHNLVASFSILGFFASLSLYERSKLFSLVTASLELAAFCLTGSLAGFWGVMAGALYIFFPGKLPFLTEFKENINGRGRKKIIFFALTAMVAGGLFAVFSQWPTASFTDRMRWWRSALEMTANSPVLGGGPGSFERTSVFYNTAGLRSLYAHSFPLQAAGEWGIFAASALFVFVFGKTRRSRDRFLTAGAVAVFFLNLFDFSLNVPGFFLLFFITLVCAAEPGEERPVKGGMAAVLYCFILTAAFYPCLYWGIKPLIACGKSMDAQTAFEDRDWGSAENCLKGSVRWDGIPANYYSGIARMLFLRSRETGNSAFLRESVKWQKEALSREPLSAIYLYQMKQLLETAYGPKT